MEGYNKRKAKGAIVNEMIMDEGWVLLTLLIALCAECGEALSPMSEGVTLIVSVEAVYGGGFVVKGLTDLPPDTQESNGVRPPNSH